MAAWMPPVELPADGRPAIGGRSVLLARRSRAVLVRDREPASGPQPAHAVASGRVRRDRGRAASVGYVSVAMPGVDEHPRARARTLELVLAQMPAVYWLVDRDLRILRTGGAIEAGARLPAGSLHRQTLYDVHATSIGAPRIRSTTHQRALGGETVTYHERVPRQAAVDRRSAPIADGDRSSA